MVSVGACGTTNSNADTSLESDPDALIAVDSKEFPATLSKARFFSLMHDAAAWKRIRYSSGKAVFSVVAISGENVTATLMSNEFPPSPFQTNFTLSTNNNGNEITLVLASPLKAGPLTAIKAGNLTLTALRTDTKVTVGLTASPTFAASVFGAAKLRSILNDLHTAVGRWVGAESALPEVAPPDVDASVPKADASAPKTDAGTADAAVADAGA